MFSRLAFPVETTTVEKLEWLKVMMSFLAANGDPTLDVVRLKSFASQYITVASDQESLIKKLQEGGIGDIAFQLCGVSRRRKKLPEYLVTRFSTDMDPEEAKLLNGVFKARRLYRNGKPINRIIIVWNGEKPPPSKYHFVGSFCPASELRPWRSSPVFCYNCMDCGHVAKYCKMPTRCGVCAESHATKDCPSNATEESEAEKAKDVTTKCCRCGKTGVPAWHRDCEHLPSLGPPPPNPVKPKKEAACGGDSSDEENDPSVRPRTRGAAGDEPTVSMGKAEHDEMVDTISYLKSEVILLNDQLKVTAQRIATDFDKANKNKKDSRDGAGSSTASSVDTAAHKPKKSTKKPKKTKRGRR